MADGKPADPEPEPEVPQRARRRTFTAKYKLEILPAYDAAEAGEKGAILRREGLYSSHIVEWRRARDAGALAQPRGRKRPDPRDAQIAALRKEKERLEQELAKVGRLGSSARRCRTSPSKPAGTFLPTLTSVLSSSMSQATTAYA